LRKNILFYKYHTLFEAEWRGEGGRREEEGISIYYTIYNYLEDEDDDTSKQYTQMTIRSCDDDDDDDGDKKYYLQTRFYFLFFG